ncbi:MAG: SoxY-related AACIE arm protein [Aquabacterium sp.]
MSVPPHSARRRRLVVSAVAAPWALVATGLSRAQDADMLAERLREAVRSFGGGRPATEGRVRLEIAELVENGNVVPVTVRVESPMTEADHVVAIALFNERNQQRDVAVFALGPVNGRAEVSTRMRLATSQTVVAAARMSDGSVWTHHVEVVVTLAACVD